MTDLPKPTPHDVIRKHLRINGITDPAWNNNIGGRIGDAIAGAFAELHPEVTLLADATVLRLEPGDTIVLTAKYPVSEKEADDLARLMMDRFPDHRAVLLDNGLQFAVARPTNG